MSDALAFLSGGGEAERMLRERDWRDHPLGSPEIWPAELKAALSLVLNSPESMILAWGPELSFFFNKAYFPLLGPRLPWAMGERFDKVWADGWEQAKPIIDEAMAGRSERFVDLPWKLGTDRGARNTWWTFSYSRVLDGNGGVAGLFIYTTETTDRVLGDAALKASQEKLAVLNAALERQVEERTAELRLYGDIVRSSAAPICAFDTAYRLIAFNQAHSDEFFRIFGYRVQLGDVFPDLFPADQAATMRGFMARALNGEVFTVTEEFGDPDLAKPYWEVSYTALHDEAGKIIGAFHFAKDISARLRAEKDLADAQAALRQSQKMEAVGQLTGGVAHDFNNLLTVIKSSTDLLKRPNLPDDRRVRYIEAIADTVDRAAKLTGQLLAFARRQALKPEVFDACESIRALSGMMSTLTGSRIAVKSALPIERCYVLADPSQFDTAIINMAVNARDAMDGVGELTLAVQAVDELPAHRSHPVVARPHVAVHVTDTGTGIAADMLDRIFEPFFTTKGLGKGTGLGLSQVFGFAKQSGGDIVVNSTLSQGTTFTLYLPRAAAPDLPQSITQPETMANGHGVRVLVVEDNVEVGTFAVQTLTDLGFATVLAPDGEAALVELAKDAERFDVVFTDVMMPGISGIELGQQVRRLYPNLPVVLTSGYSHVLAQDGPHGFELLHKPYSVEQLSRVLRETVSWQRHRRDVS